MGISNKFTYATIWNPSKLYIFRLTYCQNLFNLYRILIILSFCHSSMGLIIIHHCQSLDIMSLLSARYKVITLRIHVGYLSTCGLQACLVSVLKTDPFSESFVKNFIEFSFYAEFLHFPFLLPTRFEDMRVTKILEFICAALRAMNYNAAIQAITYPQSHCKITKLAHRQDANKLVLV